jgi:signal transduction histidine kinase
MLRVVLANRLTGASVTVFMKESISVFRFTARLIGLIGMVCWQASSALAFEGYSDPLQPSDASAVSVSPDIPFFRIGARLKQVEQELAQEAQALKILAPLQAGMQFDQFGYHSDYVPVVEGVPNQPLWTLDFSAGVHPTLGFVMVPALDQSSPELKGYAFPKRFRICSIDEQGRSDKVYVDWTAQDFPDPGMRPVYFGFSAADASISQLRLEVFAGHQENGLEFFALGRIRPIRQGEQQKLKLLTVSSSFESAPYWSATYLASPRYTLGMPLSAKDGAGGNLILNLPSSHLEKPLVIRVELDQTDELGWVNLFPGQSPAGIDVPGYGFPKTFRISRLVKKKEKRGFRRILLPNQELLKNPGNNMLRLAGFGRVVDALEIACNDFPVYQGQAVFSLGEIELIRGERALSKGCTVNIRGADWEESPDLGELVDGKVGGRDILLLPEWLQQLAAGKPHETRIRMLEAERRLLVARWQRISRWVWIGLGMLVLTGVSVFVLIMLRTRKKAELRLRHQISSDLHDDVGSSLGSISLMAGQLERLAPDVRLKEGLVDLALMTREACASLREVVWVTDQSTIRLPVLIQKLSERAERVLTCVELSVEIPDDCPNEVVSLTFKRHLIMFFKEVVHNCARHAQATQVRVAVSVAGRQLQILVADNGCGFDTSVPSNGWGLASMGKRAQEMGGEMELTSRPGEGTTIVMTMPLAALSKELNRAYKTSN